MGTIDSEDQEARLSALVIPIIPNVDSCHRCHAVPWLAQGIVESPQSGLVEWETTHFVQSDPVDFSFTHSEEIAEQRYAQHRSRPTAESRIGQPLKEGSCAPRGTVEQWEKWTSFGIGLPLII